MKESTIFKIQEMKKTILMLCVILLSGTFCSAQKIESEKIFGGYKYTQNGKIMTMNDLVQTMKSNTEAFKYIKKAKSNYNAGLVLGSIGGFLLGWPIGTSIGGGDPNWALAGAGVAIIAITIPINKGFNKNATKAIDIYNASLDNSSAYNFEPQFQIIGNANGLGIAMNF